MTQYLILHKVRGEPAFDVAEPMDLNGEEIWIVPTSGHRAYPYCAWPLAQIRGEQLDIINDVRLATNFDGWLKNWPDHYTINEKPAKKGSGLNLMDFIKLPPPDIKLRRRI